MDKVGYWHNPTTNSWEVYDQETEELLAQGIQCESLAVSIYNLFRFQASELAVIGADVPDAIGLGHTTEENSSNWVVNELDNVCDRYVKVDFPTWYKTAR